MDLCGTIALFIRKKDGWDLLFQLIISVFYSYQRVVFIRIIDTFRDSNKRNRANFTPFFNKLNKRI